MALTHILQKIIEEAEQEAAKILKKAKDQAQEIHKNAEEKIADMNTASAEETKKRKEKFVPIGVAQGWSPDSYAFAVKELQKRSSRSPGSGRCRSAAAP